MHHAKTKTMNITLSTTNTIPEFILILVGMIVVMAVAAALMQTCHEKIVDFKDKNRRDNVPIFARNEINSDDDFLRFGNGSPGETSRVLTKNYYDNCFVTKTKNDENLLNLLRFRNTAYSQMGVALDDYLLRSLAQNGRNITKAIFALVLYENSLDRNVFFTEENLPIIYRIVQEEYNRIAPHNQQESIPYERMTLFTIKSTFEKYQIQL
jgi:hypothetical protein